VARVLLDTTVLIDLLRGRRGAVDRLRALRRAGDGPYVCAVNVDEVHRGLRGATESEAAARLFDGLEVIALGRAEGRRAGEWRRDYARRGVTLTQADCLVAAAAAALGGRLATGNPAHFPMDELAVEHWPANS
jgi:predicted nucleic acid-binding protein